MVFTVYFAKKRQAVSQRAELYHGIYRIAHNIHLAAHDISDIRNALRHTLSQLIPIDFHYSGHFSNHC